MDRCNGHYHLVSIGLLFLTSYVHCITEYRMEEWCGRQIQLDRELVRQGRLVTDVWTSHLRPKMAALDSCVITLKARGNESRLMFYFERLDVSCSSDALDFFDGTSINTYRIQGLDNTICGHEVPDMVAVTAGNHLTIRYKYKLSAQPPEAMRIIFTSFHEGPCVGSEYQCDNKRCISESLSCKNINSCGDFTKCDELTTGEIAIILIVTTVGVLLISIVLGCCLRYYVCQSKDREKTFIRIKRPSSRPDFSVLTPYSLSTKDEGRTIIPEIRIFRPPEDGPKPIVFSHGTRSGRTTPRDLAVPSSKPARMAHTAPSA